MFYGLNGPPEIDAVLMFFQLWREKGREKKKKKKKKTWRLEGDVSALSVCTCFFAGGICATGPACVRACGIPRTANEDLSFCPPPPLYSLYLKTSAPTPLQPQPCGTPPLAGPLWTMRNHPDLPYVISHTLGELHNKSSTISPPDVDTRAQASPPARSIKRYLLKRCSILWDSWHSALPDSAGRLRAVNRLPAWFLLFRQTPT